MSLYLRGIQGNAPAKSVTIGAASGTSEPGFVKTMIFGSLLIGGVWFFFFRKKKTVSGPDTSDIDARYHARGVDPRTYY